jgi:Spy/CpxP family protein refolding chaperone
MRLLFLIASTAGLMLAQGPMGSVCRPGKTARDMNLTDAQQKQVSGICQDSLHKLYDLREAVNRAEADLQAAFDESPVDQGKSTRAIEHLAAARSDLFTATSQMDLKIRTVLTDDQWKQLKMRHGPGGMGRTGGPPSPDGGWRRGKGSTKSTTNTTQPNK